MLYLWDVGRVFKELSHEDAFLLRRFPGAYGGSIQVFAGRSGEVATNANQDFK